MAHPTYTGFIPTWTLADRLRKARTAAGLTQDALAELLDVGVRTVKRAENGQVQRRTVLSWAMVCAVDALWLEHGIGDPTDSGQPLVNSLDTRRYSGVLDGQAAA